METINRGSPSWSFGLFALYPTPCQLCSSMKKFWLCCLIDASTSRLSFGILRQSCLYRGSIGWSSKILRRTRKDCERSIPNASDNLEYSLIVFCMGSCSLIRRDLIRIWNKEYDNSNTSIFMIILKRKEEKEIVLWLSLFVEYCMNGDCYHWMNIMVSENGRI